jgi:AAA+ ATPase superfamily predicted ATPase
MLFGRVKKSRKDMFDREYEFNQLVGAIEDGVPLIVLTGIRRIGKTALAKVLLNEIDFPGAYVDVRKLWSLRNSVTPDDLKGEIIKSLLSRKRYTPVLELLKSLRGVRVGSVGIEFRERESTLMDLLDDLEKSGKKTVLVFDEAQYLRYSKHDYTSLLASLNDNYENLIVILTGSEIQILEEFLGFNNRYSPLYKREHEIVCLERFSRDESLSYLRTGFKEVGMDVPDKELEDAVETLDGIVGWLREYGWMRYRGKSHPIAIEEVFQRAKRDIIDELSRYSPRYLRIMLAVAEGYHSWRAVKGYVEAMEGREINKGTLYTEIKNLIRYGYLEKRRNKYHIVDPVIKRALRHPT